MSWVVLILEDDITLQEVLVEALEDCECYEVHAASSPGQALEIAAKMRFDLAVTDVRMDEMDGIQCMSRIKELQPDLRTIVITGYASDDAPGRAIQLEAEDYLYKPFSRAQFLTSVERVLQVEKEIGLYDQILSAVNMGLRRWAELAASVLAQAELNSLEKGRNRAFQSYFVAIRSDLLRQGDAMGVWDRLEQLEEDREQLKVPGHPPGLRRSVADGYRYVVDLLAALSRAGLMAQPAARKPNQVDPHTFARLYKRIKAGELSSEQVKLAPFLRRVSSQTRADSTDLEALYQATWGEGTRPATVSR